MKTRRQGNVNETKNGIQDHGIGKEESLCFADSPVTGPDRNDGSCFIWSESGN